MTSSWLSPVTWNILAVETGERFAYFGFRAILVLYFTLSLEYSDRQAIAFFAYTTCLAYLSPILGAVLADGYWGRYTTILWFSVIYVVGLAVLSLGASIAGATLTIRRTLSFGGLFLVCLGTGGIKPCVSAFGADQVSLRPTRSRALTVSANTLELFDDGTQEEEGGNSNQHVVSVAITAPADTMREETARSEQVRAFFAYFYFCINIGAVTSIALVPILRSRFGFGVAFLLPTAFMMTVIALFLSRRREYIHLKPGHHGASLATTFRLSWWLLRCNLWSVPWISQLLPFWRPGPSSQRFTADRMLVPSDEDAGDKSGRDLNQTEAILEQQLDDAAQALHVLPIMAMFPIFWCLYDQQSSVWTLQANRMELNGLQPEQLNIVNPLQIMILIPLFDKCVYPAMEQRRINIQPLRRMSWGMFLAAVAFFVSGRVESAIQYRNENDLPLVNVFWQLPQITILAVAEIFLSVTGLEFAYATSPDRLKAFLMSIYLLTTAAGDFLGGILYSTAFEAMNLATVMDVCAVLMLVNLGFFLLVARWWERLDFRSLRRTPSLEGLEIPVRSMD